MDRDYELKSVENEVCHTENVLANIRFQLNTIVSVFFYNEVLEDKGPVLNYLSFDFQSKNWNIFTADSIMD